MRLSVTTAFQINLVLRQASLVIVSILMVKSGLPADAIGTFETLLYVATTMSFFWLNAFLQGILSFCASADEKKKKKIIFNIALVVQILCIISVLFVFIFKKSFITFLTNKENIPFFHSFLLYILFNLPPHILESFWTVENRPFSILAYAAISYILLPLSIMLPIWLGEGLGGGILGMVALSIIRYGWFLIIIVRNNVFTFDKTIIRTFFMLSLPLIGYTFLSGFVVTYSNWLVNKQYNGDTIMFAIFRLGAREFPLSLALATGLSSAIVPMLTIQPQQNLYLLKEKSVRLWHIIFPVSTVLMLSAEWLFRIVFSVEYIESAVVFKIYLFLLLSRALFPQSVLLALKETKLIFQISIIETLSILILSFMGVKIMGLQGIAWATVVGFGIEKILMIGALKRKYGLSLSSYTNVKTYCFYVAGLILAYIFSHFEDV